MNPAPAPSHDPLAPPSGSNASLVSAAGVKLAVPLCSYGPGAARGDSPGDRPSPGAFGAKLVGPVHAGAGAIGAIGGRGGSKSTASNSVFTPLVLEAPPPPTRVSVPPTGTGAGTSFCGACMEGALCALPSPGFPGFDLSASALPGTLGAGTDFGAGKPPFSGFLEPERPVCDVCTVCLGAGTGAARGAGMVFTREAEASARRLCSPARISPGAFSFASLARGKGTDLR